MSLLPDIVDEGIIF